MPDPTVNKQEKLAGDSKGLAVRITPPGASGVLLRGEKAAIRVDLYNHADLRSQAQLRVTLTPFRASVAEQKYEFDVTVDAEAGMAREIELSTDEIGYWRVQAEAVVAGEVACQAVSAVAIVEKPRTYGQDDPDSFWGAMIITDYEAAERIGIKLDRPQAYWRFLSLQHSHDNLESLDMQIDKARAHGMGIILTIRPEMPEGQAPSWVTWKNDHELAEEPYIEIYRQFVREMVERYRGRLVALELLNEPDLAWFQFPGWETEDAARIVATLNREGYKVVKEVAPELPVIGLDMSGVDMLSGFGFTRACLEQGAQGQFDFYGGHPYTSARFISEAQREHWPEDYDLRGMVTKAQDIMEEYGLSRRYWNTEIGWAWKEGLDPLSDPMIRHAAITARALIELRSVPDMDKIIWFDFSYPATASGDNYSLVSGYPRLAACTYAATAYALHRAKPAGAVSIIPEIRAWRFDSTEDNQTVVTLWDDRPGMVLNTQGVDSLVVYDMLGRVVASGADVKVALSREPLFYVVPLADGDLLVERLGASQCTAGEPLAMGMARLVDSQTLKVAIENRAKDAADFVVELDGERHNVRVMPGVSYCDLKVQPAVVAGESRSLQVAVEGYGYRITRVVDSNPLPLRKVVGMSIDGELQEVSGLNEIVMADRSWVKPPDATVAWHGPDDLSATLWMGWTDDGLYFAARVKDDVHHAADDMGWFWLYDSVRIAVDALDDPTSGNESQNVVVIGAALTPQGPKAFLRAPGRTTFSPNIPLAIRRDETTTAYEMLIPWSELKTAAPRVGRIFRLNCVIADNDGSGRKCWLELSGDISDRKGSSTYREFMFV